MWLSEHCTPAHLKQGSLQSSQPSHSGLADFRSQMAWISSLVWALTDEEERRSTQRSGSFAHISLFSFLFILFFFLSFFSRFLICEKSYDVCFLLSFIFNHVTSRQTRFHCACKKSGVAQGKRGGLITRRSVDRNHSPLIKHLSFFIHQ